MFLAVFVVLIASVCGRDLQEPRFQVLTPDELMVQVPSYNNMNLVTFRIGVKRKDNELEDLELGENTINNNRIFIYDNRLKLKRGDVVNYLLAFKDNDAYHAKTGKYIFDGEYYKKPLGRRLRFRRGFPIISTTEKSEYNVDDAEEFDPVDSRFGGGHHHRGRWPGYNPNGFNPRPFGGPNFGPPPFPGYPKQGPNFGADCNDHRHDMCHQRHSGRWEKSTKSPVGFLGTHDKEYHCRMCHKDDNGLRDKSTTTTTSTEVPDIDVRFSNDEP